jgi:hypothetical protein
VAARSKAGIAAVRRCRRAGARALRLTVTFAALCVGALALPGAALARNQEFGYNGGAALSGTMGCAEGATCLAYAYEGAAYPVPVTGTIKKFSLDHSGEGRSGQSAALVLIEPSTAKVVKISEFLPLSTSAETQKLELSTPVEAQRGETLAVAVHPGSGQHADNVFASGSYAGGAAAECVMPSTGESVTGKCLAEDPVAVVAVNAYVEDLIKPPAIVEPYEMTNIGPFDATFEAEVNPNGQATTALVEYGTSEASLSDRSAQVMLVAGNSLALISTRLEGLLPETKYYVRLFASNYDAENNSGDEVQGGVQHFETGPAPPPQISAQENPTALTGTSATLSATLNAEGASTEFKVLYGTAGTLGQSTPATVLASVAGESYAPTITGLAPATTYSWKIVAYRKGVQVAESPVRQFTTYRPPAVALGAPSNVGQSTVTLNGALTAYGVSTSYHFEYGTTTAYGASTPSAEVGSANGANAVPVGANIGGLAPDTTYHYRLIAESAGGSAVTADGTFATASGLPPAVGSFKFTELLAFEAVFDFTVDPEGYATTFSVQWGPTTAYGNTTEGGTTAPVVGPIGLNWDAEDVLNPGTTYHLRVVATNRWGTTYGPDVAFTTSALLLTYLVQEFGMSRNDATVPVNLANPLFVLGSRFSCPPACKVQATVFAIGPHHKQIKLGTALFKVPRDKHKHRLAIRLSRKAVALLRHHRRLHIKVRYKITGASQKAKSTTIVSNLTLKGRAGHRRRRR